MLATLLLMCAIEAGFGIQPDASTPSAALGSTSLISEPDSAASLAHRRAVLSRQADRLAIARARERRAAQREQRMRAAKKAALSVAPGGAEAHTVRRAAPTTSPTAAPSPQPAPVSYPVSGNRALGLKMMLAAGWGRDQWPALEALWSRESGWNHLAANPSSSAYGIPQALPGSKMASAGADWRTNPATQIRWGLGYIRGRYGSPSAALAHSNATGWY